MSIHTYTALSGFFAQDNPSTDPSILSPLPPRFGLLDASPSRWHNLVSRLDGTTKLLILARHGEAVHDLAKAKYGARAWDDYWAARTGDGALVWGPDPPLTAAGEAQALAARALWAAERACGMIAPAALYCSPLTRAMRTAQLTFPDLPSRAVAIDEMRRLDGAHTCDQRRARSVIAAAFCAFDVDGMAEADELWGAAGVADAAARARRALDMMWADEGAVVAVVAHGRIINGFLGAVGRAQYPVPVGGCGPRVDGMH